MKAEINNENRLKFEALYIGQNVFRSCRVPNISGILKPINLARKPSKYDWLELRSISKISNYHAIEMSYVNSTDALDYYEGNSIPLSELDYLRSKGYALPWMGLSVDEMINAGWVKLTEQ